MTKKKKIVTLITTTVVAIILISATIFLSLWISLSVQKEHPEFDMFHQARVDMLSTFNKMELGEKKPMKREINEKKPVHLINSYGGEFEEIWKTLPEAEKEISIILLIPSHLYLESASPIEGLERNADRCEELGIPYLIQHTMGEMYVEELTPLSYLEERFAKRHKMFYGLSSAELYNGIMWRGEMDSNYSHYIVNSIKLSAKYGGMFFWTDTNVRYKYGMIMDWFEQNNEMYSTFKAYSNYIYMLNKDSALVWSTSKVQAMTSSFSVMQGLWLAGLIGGWGSAGDWWSFSINGNTTLFGEYDQYIDHYSEVGYSFPENMYTMQFAYVASRGGFCFKAEAPNMSVSIEESRVPGYEYSLSPFLDSILSGRIDIPTREQVLNDTVAVVVGGKNYPEFQYNFKESYRFPNTGLLNIIPLLPSNLRLEERAVFESRGIKLIEKKLSQKEYTKLFDNGTITGNTYATKTFDQWYYVNNLDNIQGMKKSTMYTKVASSEYFSIDASEHTYAIIKEKSNKLEFNINNYRTDKGNLIKKDYADDLSWVDIAKEFLKLDENGNPIMLDDSVKRKTVVVIKGSLGGGKPEVLLLNPENGEGGYNRPYSIEQSWDEQSKTLTLTIMHNGRVNFDVMLDDSQKSHEYTAKQAIAPTLKKNSNDVSKLVELTKTLITDEENYTTYSYLNYKMAYENAITMIEERTYSKSQINDCAKNLKKAQELLLDVKPQVDYLRKVIAIDKQAVSQEKYDQIMKQYDRTLREILSPKQYFAGKNNREFLGFADFYKNKKYSASVKKQKIADIDYHIGLLKELVGDLV